MDALEEMVREAYERTIGLELSDLAVDWDIAVDCCIREGPLRRRRRVVAGKSPVERGKRGIKRSRWPSMPMGHPLGYITAPRPTNRHDSPLLCETLDTA